VVCGGLTGLLEAIALLLLLAIVRNYRGLRSFWASFAATIVSDYRPCSLFVPEGFKEYAGNAGKLSVDPFVETPKGTEVVVIDSMHPLPVRHC